MIEKIIKWGGGGGGERQLGRQIADKDEKGVEAKVTTE